MSHKAGHIIIQSKAANPTEPGITAAEIEIEFPVGMEIEERIKQVRHAMKVMDKLDHPDGD